MGECSVDNTEEKWIKHYCSSHKILLIGEGDFSFAACLAKAFGSAENLTATSFDSRELLMKGYCDGPTNLEELEKRKCTVLHGVDAHTMTQHPLLHSKLFDRIVFNFPHAGFFCPESSRSQIVLHQELVRGFLRSASHMLTEDGEIHITHKTTYPFSNWEIVKLAEGLCLLDEVPFYKWDYPGYINKRGSGRRIGRKFTVGECSTFKFAKPRHAINN